MKALVTFNIDMEEYKSYDESNNKIIISKICEDNTVDLTFIMNLMNDESDYIEYIEKMFPSADDINIEIIDDVDEEINDKQDNTEQRIIVEYYEGGFYDQEGGDHKLHVFNRIDQIKPVLWSACRPYLENCNNLKVYVQKDMKSGAVEDCDVLREQVYNIITGS